MTTSRRRFLAIAAGIALLCGAALPFLLPEPLHYLPDDTARFVALFPAPPASDSAETRRELDALLELQRTRTLAQVDAARADRKKDVGRFFAVLGLDPANPPALPRLRRLTDRLEGDVSKYVRAPKQAFRRLRPYEVEPRLKPCIDDVQGDLSYPSGHATYGYVVGSLLAEIVPEKRGALEKRADEFAQQRAVCGVHFPSDLEAGRRGAFWLAGEFDKSGKFQEDAAAASAELRAALAAAGKLTPWSPPD